MAFSKTTDQIRKRTKTVTRRPIESWKKLKVGDIVTAIAKGQGLKLGEKVEHLAMIRIVSTGIQRLDSITPEDVAKEGFFGWTPQQFIAFYGEPPGTRVRRIEFEYIFETV